MPQDNLQQKKKPRAFIVYSSPRHVNYINDVLAVIESILISFDIDIIYLGEGFKGIRYYPEMIRKNISESDFGIVILDGLRPNVTYELGLLQMRNIDVIPLIKDDAKFAVKSIYYNTYKRTTDSELAFGDYHYRKSAFKNLLDPKIVIPEHFSDCQGMEEIRYTTIDDSVKYNSLGYVLREEITKIIPHLRSRTGPGFDELHVLFPEIDLTILDESVRLLSLFSVLGWNQNYDGDTTFQSIREEFMSFFINKQVTVDQVITIFNSLLESSENIIKNYGRYLTIDSERLIHQSFAFLMQNDEIFNSYYIHILESTQTELKRRFIDRITSKDVLDNSIIEAIGNYIFDRSNLFPDISIIQDKDSSQFFVSSAYIDPSKALDLLDSWISPLKPTKLAELFPFQSTIGSPGNPQDSVLWFLNNVSKTNSFFTTSMNIMFKFALPVVVHEELILGDIHSGVQKLALDRFLEQCHSLVGEVNVRTRWNFIKCLPWSEAWLDDYKKASKILKFRAVQNFLQRSWSIPGPVREGVIRFNHYRLPNGLNYEELENCRSEAYDLIIEWLDQIDQYSDIYDSLFEYFYRNLPDCLKYIPWDKIKSLFIRIFNNDNRKNLEFLSHIDKLRAYDEWQKSFSEENLRLIYQFQEELEKSLPFLDLFRRKMNYSIYTPEIIGMYSDQTEREEYINSVQDEIIKIYIGLDNTESKEVTDMLLLEEFNQNYEFGLNLKNHLTWEKIKIKIEYCADFITNNRNEKISEFYIGLWSSFFHSNEEEWKKSLEHYWENPVMQPYLEKILSRSSQYFNDFRWNKYIELFESELIGPIELINVVYRKEAISVDEIRLILIKCLKFFEEILTTEIQYPIEFYIRFIWRMEHLITKNEDLLNDVLAESFLNTFQPISTDILSQLHNTDIIIKIGKFSEQNFIKWLKTGFQLSVRDDNFLIKCSDIFIDPIFQITEKLFAVPPINGEATEDLKIAYSFQVLGDPRILLKFSDDQIARLYELNSSMLGSLFGRLIRNSPIESTFPPSLRSLLINHNDDLEFKERIFQSFSTGVRVFSGNNYDQQYEGDYKRITKWRESAINSIFREWLKELHQYINSLKESNREFWREREVE